MTQLNALGTLRQHLAGVPWPIDFFAPEDLPRFLDGIYVIETDSRRAGGELSASLRLAFEGELALRLPGLDGVALVVGGGPDAIEGFTLVHLGVRLGARTELTLHDVAFSLRFDRDVLAPAPGEDGQVADHAQIYVRGSVTIDDAFDVRVRGFDALQLSPVLLGASGISLSASDVKLDLSRTTALPEVLAAGFSEDFLGVFIGEAKVRFPDSFPALAPEDLVLSNAAIGSGGVSGTLAATYAPVYDEPARRFVGRGAGALGGVPFGLREVDLALRANAFERARMAGDLLLPFFELPVSVELGLTLGGGFTVGLAPGADQITLRREGVVEILVAQLGFEVTGAGLTTRLSGTVRPLLGGLAWPAFEVRELEIDASGNVRCDGGWLELPEQCALDFHGFALELTRIAFGRDDDGGRWIGLSGGISLGGELRAGASVDGLRAIWYDDGRAPRVTLEGVDVALDLPEVLRFRGRVSYRALPAPEGTVHRFDGAIELELVALDLRLDGQLVITSAGGAPALAIYLAAELPAGIPLWATGLSLYGIQGLFAVNLEPDRAPAEAWYEGWYLRAPAGATELAKWAPRAGARALGAGLTIGTTADNGFLFSARTALVLVFPGPIILVEGKANLFAERADLGSDPAFRALAVLDRRSDTLSIGLDARYRQGADGRLIDIAGRAEAFFQLSRGDAWHIYLGEKEPRERRMRARALSLFEADAYLMADAQGLALGASAGWGKQWKFGPLAVGLEAWLAADAAVSWRPLHFHGELSLRGRAKLAVYGYGVSLGVEARIAADVLDPFHLLGELEVEIGLPWPLPDFGADIRLEWGPEPVFPPLPAPLLEASVEHFKVTETWPLPAGHLLAPRVDRGDGYLLEALPAPPLAAPPPADAPEVPLDARPRLTFARPVHDDARAGVNGRETVPAWERIGDPAAGEGPVQVRHGLREVALEAWRGGAWAPVARSVGAAHPVQNPPGLPRLWGSWAPVPRLPDLAGGAVAQVKLFLWSRTPFDHVRRTGAEWADWVSEHLEDYPCIPLPEPAPVCHDLDGLVPGELVAPPWHHPQRPEVSVSWWPPILRPVGLPIAAGAPVIGIGLRHLEAEPGKPPGPAWFVVSVPAPNRGVRIGVVDPEGVSAVGIDLAGTEHGPVSGGTPASPWVELAVPDLVAVRIAPVTKAWLYRVCVIEGLSLEEELERQELAQHAEEELVRWSQDGHVLAPDTAYRLRIATTVEARGEGELSGTDRSHELVQLAYFRTGGPPGIGAPADLGRYVRQTTPPTVPAEGEALALPRPVFRAYDVGVDFNEDYVELMYRLGGRDLGLYLFDANGRPARDPGGQLAAPRYRWARSADPALDEAEQRWLTLVAGSPCLALDPQVIPHPAALRAAGAVLAPDTVYQARLVPLLVHDDFRGAPAGTTATGTGAVLGAWTVADASAVGGPGRWRLVDEGAPPDRALAQLAAVGAAPADPRAAHRPGTLLRRSIAGADYRISAHLRSSTGGALGVAVRVTGPERGYLFAMDRTGRYRRLLRMESGAWTVLAEDDRAYQVDRDYLVAVEVLGAELRVHVDGEPLFTAVDELYAEGGVALYAARCPDARWKDVRVDDLGAAAPVPYRFDFTTSRYASFRHLAHGGAQRRWTAAAPAGLAGLRAAAVVPVVPPVLLVPPSGDEARAYDAAAALIAGAAAHQRPAALSVARLVDAAGLQGYLIESPEPIDWRRAALALEAGPRPEPPAALGSVRISDGMVRIADAVVSPFAPGAAAVEVIADGEVDLSRLALEELVLPGDLELGGVVLLDERFPGPAGLLHEERFDDGTAARLVIADEGTIDGPSRWRVEDGRLRHLGEIRGGDPTGADPAQPGTLALLGDPAWADVALEVSLRSDDPDGDPLGVVIRRGESGDCYRLALDARLGHRRLVRIAGGAATVLWEEAGGYELGRVYRVALEAHGPVLAGRIDGALAFHLVDPAPDAPRAGRIGCYCWSNDRASFEAIRVERLERAPAIREPALEPRAWQIEDEPGATGVSDWLAAPGGLHQAAAISAVDAAGLDLGTTAFDSGTHGDLALDAVFTAPGSGVVGVVFRHGEAGHYRLTLSAAADKRRLIRRGADGAATTLWVASGAYTPGARHRLSLRAIGERLEAELDGELLFRVVDRGGLTAGTAGLYTSGDARPTFHRAALAEPVRHAGGWRIVDDGHEDGPSRWRVARGLAQRAPIHGGGDAPADPDKPGTCALAGDAAWADVRVEVRLRSDEDGALGVIVRRTAAGHYLLSLDRARAVRRLCRVQGGTAVTLWEQAGGYPPGRPFDLALDAVGDRLRATLDGAPLFDLRDAALSAGQIGVYAWRNPGLHVERVVVRRPPLTSHLLFADRFAAGDLTGWTAVDEGAGGPSVWAIDAGVLRQTSNIMGPPLHPTIPEKPGTQLVAGDPAWTDVVLTVRLLSNDPNAIGVVFRYQSATEHYRFSMDRTGQRWLVKRSGGAHTVLWQDSQKYELGRPYQLTIAAIGGRLRGFLDGAPLFDVADGTLATGRIGLYCWANQDARFSQVQVHTAGAAFTGWALDDELRAFSRTRWQVIDDPGALVMSAWGAAVGLAQTAACEGTVVIAGAPFADGRAVAHVVVPTVGSAGVVARHRGPGDYYALLVAPDPATGKRLLRLERVSGGQRTALVELPVAAAAGRSYHLALDAIGARLTGWLDGVPVLATTDGAHAAGRIGLRTAGAADARFLAARGGAARWAHAADLARDASALAPAGTRVRVRVAQPAAPAAAEASLRELLAPVVGGPGVLRPGTGPLALRVIERRADGSTVEVAVRRCYPAAAYAARGFRVLRRADGTGLVVFLEPAATAAESELLHRLRVTYARAGVPGAPALSEAGFTDPELAVIEL